MIELKDVCYKGILNNVNAVFNNNYEGEIIGNNSIIYMNQTLYFDNRLKAYDFVEFVFELNNMKKKKNLFLEYIERFGNKKDFIDMLDKKVGVLSGGEKVKLFFTTLTFIDREWYIFDEPFAGVDTQGKEYMCEVIKDLLQREKNVIITTHEEHPIYNFDNVNLIHINKGKVI